MPTTTAIANGSNEVERNAARDANEIQDACNLVAIVGCWHQHLLAMHRVGIGGDRLINHPTSLVFISKLNSLLWNDSEPRNGGLRRRRQAPPRGIRRIRGDPALGPVQVSRFPILEIWTFQLLQLATLASGYPPADHHGQFQLL